MRRKRRAAHTFEPEGDDRRSERASGPAEFLARFRFARIPPQSRGDLPCDLVRSLGFKGELGRFSKWQKAARGSGGRASISHLPDRRIPAHEIDLEGGAGRIQLKVQHQIPGRRVVEEGRGEGEHIVKLPGISRAGQILRCHVHRPVKHERVVRAEIVGESRAHSRDGTRRGRGANLQSKQARA